MSSINFFTESLDFVSHHLLAEFEIKYDCLYFLMIWVTENTFIFITRVYCYLPTNKTNVFMRGFRGMYVVPPHVCNSLWTQLSNKILLSAFQPMHVLWTLQFLKSYISEHINCGVWRWDEKRHCKRTWHVIERIASFEIVISTFNFENYFEHCVHYNIEILSTKIFCLQRLFDEFYKWNENMFILP